MKKLAVAFALLVPAAGLAQVPPDAGFVFYTIPGIVNTSGLNDTRWVSDVAITNPGTKDAFLAVSFVPGGSLTPQVLSLPAGATTVSRNVLKELWSSSGAGALSIASDQKLILRARTYNTAAGGTYGVALPVYDSDGFILPGGRAHSLWVSQSADPNAGYRTNIAVLFPDADGGQATVTVFDADGQPLGHQDYALDSAGFQQLGVGSFAGAAPVARAEIQVSSGHAVGYSVVVDNVTGDSSLFAFEALPVGIQDVLVNGVARANGRNGTFFRTDGRFFNPGATDATVTVAFHANESSNPSPLTRDFVIPAGKIIDVVDVLDSLMGLPVGSAGALRFTSDSAVAILCRTSNVDPAGVKPGTFGAQQKPVPLLSFLSSADEGALITGLRQNAVFRTNVGFAAGEDGASWTLTLRNKTGATLATTTGALGPFGWTQPNVQDLFPNLSIPDDAELQVKVTSGSVDVFDSSIDNASGDSVVTPIALLPAEIPSSATIGPAGGSVRSDDGILTLKVPAGALSAPTAISIATTSGPDLPLMSGSTYLILPDGLSFSREALLVQSYTAQDLIGTAAEALSLGISDGSSWYVMTGGSLDVSRRTLTVPLDRLTPPTLVRQAQAKAGGSGTAVRWMTMWGIDRDSFGPQVEGSGASIRFTLYHFRTNPSTRQKKGSPAQKAGTVSPWSATWSEDGKFMEIGESHKYHVPACAPKKAVSISAVPTSAQDVVFTERVDVYPRTWIVQIQQYMENTECSSFDLSSKLPLPMFHFETYLTRTFTLGDDLTFKVSSDVNTGTVTQTGPTLCPYQGHDCHYTAVAMSKIENAGEIISVTKGPRTFASLYVRVLYDDLEFPSFEWSASNCRPPETSHKFPGLASFPAFQDWPLDPDGFRFKEPAKSEFVSPDGMVSTQSFWVKIDPYPSPSCPR